VSDYEIRPATLRDLDTVLHHRRRMFEDMGYTDAAALEAMLASATPLLRRGLARRLMDTMLAWCRAQGMHSIYLHASDHGRPLYESLGFTATNEMRIVLGPRFSPEVVR
jgi:GNAT superfamily N-acetyltransferase